MSDGYENGGTDSGTVTRIGVLITNDEFTPLKSAGPGHVFVVVSNNAAGCDLVLETSGLAVECDALRARVAELEAERDANALLTIELATVRRMAAEAEREHDAAITALETSRDYYRGALRAQLDARPQWTTQAPTVPGMYWTRDRDGARECVEVAGWSSDRLLAFRCGVDGPHELGYFCEWAGPLVAP